MAASYPVPLDRTMRKITFQEFVPAMQDVTIVHRLYPQADTLAAIFISIIHIFFLKNIWHRINVQQGGN